MKMIRENTMIPKENWSTWVAYGDYVKTQPAAAAPSAKRADRVPLTSFSGVVFMHNNTELITGRVSDVSKTGLFVLTDDRKIPKDSLVKLTLKIPALLPAMNITGRVARFNADPIFPIGYGVSFSESLKHLT